MTQRVPILVYHHVYPDDEAARAGAAAGIIGVTEFDRQMQYLLCREWTVVTTSRVIDWLRRKGELPQRACVLHFDNGWLDTYTVVEPRLRELGISATSFPITSGVVAASGGTGLCVRTLTEGSIEKPFMTWQLLRQLAEAGWEIGAHTHTHCKVADQHDREGDAGVLREVEQSDQLFREHLGFVPEHFAYPSGSRSDRTDAVLRERYQSLRLWRWDWPIQWFFTDRATSRWAIACQNIDSRVGFEQFERIFHESANLS